MYDAQLADVYETIYRSRGKDWSAEANDVIRLIRFRFPEAASMLDVACGTGAHLEIFADAFQHAEGLEISDAMRDLALHRLPDITVHRGDMSDFKLDRTFDAVACLFCAIAYLGTVERMRDAVRCMADHVVPGGVIVIEPWWFPERFIEGYVAGDLARGPDRTIARISHSTREGRATRMEARFTVADADGITAFTEIDFLTLYTREEYESAFTDAGCVPEYLEGGLTGRGLFVGVKQG